jgi:hypothetical protein
MRELSSSLGLLPAVQPRTIGHSEEGRPLVAYHLGMAAAPLRVLVVGGQHGDEGRARRAIERFPAENPAATLAMSLALIPNLNPDGAARKQRSNARGIDLNRDHQLLLAAETLALHRFVRDWRPHLVLDIHLYPPRRRRLLQYNLVHCHDLLLDVPNNPAVSATILDDIAPRFLESALRELTARGFQSDRYVVTTASGKVRHSTTDVIDARNGVALRYGVPVVLIEGRKPTRADTATDRRRLRIALQNAIEVALDWAGRNVKQLTREPAEVQTVAIRSRRLPADTLCRMRFMDPSSGAIRPADIPGSYLSGVRTTKRVLVPEAYAVPRTHSALIELLHRHGFESQPGPDVAWPAEYYRYRSVERPGGQARLKVEKVKADCPLKNYYLFTLTSATAAPLSVYLEPRSNHGLRRYGSLIARPQVNPDYPILRVLQSRPVPEP